MAHGKFEFKGAGLGYLWPFIWTFLSIYIGIFYPWAYAAQQRYIAAHTFIEGKQLCFNGTAPGIFANWLLIIILSIITFISRGEYAGFGDGRQITPILQTPEMLNLLWMPNKDVKEI